MKSRVALIAVLALGVFMSGTGATLAVSGFANTGSASTAQYGPENNQPKKHHVVPNKNHQVVPEDHQAVEAAHGEGGNCTFGSGSGTGSTSGTGAGENCEEAAPAAATQAVQQVAATSSGSSLPFTGFVAVPVLIVGLGLLAAGFAMRMRVRKGDHTA